tara:strand:- start:4011 stop:4253 length:243 start_codon:yes stop_codon:yes gene_type:complete
MPRKKAQPRRLELTITQGTGVLGKDGTPYAPSTMHTVEGKWQAPAEFHIRSLIDELLTPEVDEIIVIDENNVETTIKITR